MSGMMGARWMQMQMLDKWGRRKVSCGLDRKRRMTGNVRISDDM